jgi:opacity protein-like surface antigen
MCISVATLLVVGALKADAQKAEIGFRFMPTFSSFDMENTTGGTVKGKVTLGYGAGAFLGFNLTENVGIQGEVIYSSISQKYKEVDVEYKVNLRYVNIPLMLSLNTGKTQTVNANLVAGLQVGVSVGSSVTTSGIHTTNYPEPLLIIKKGDLGFAYGAGVDFGLTPSKTFRLGIGFRGVYGLLDISDNSSNTTTDSFYILDKTHVKTYSGYIGISWIF